MRIALENLSTARLAFSVPGIGNRPQVLEFSELLGIFGQLERSVEQITLAGIRVQRATVSGLDWLVGDIHLLSGLPVTTEDVAADMNIPVAVTAERSVDGPLERAAEANAGASSPVGRLTCGEIDASSVSAALLGHRVTGGLVVRGLEWAGQRDGWQAQLSELRAAQVQTVIAGLVARLGSAVATHMHVTRLSSGRMTASVARVSVAKPSAQGRGIQVSAEELSVSEGLRLADESPGESPGESPDESAASVCVVVPLAIVRGVSVTIEDFSGLLGERESSGRTLEELFDVTQLDRVSGQVHVDVTMDADLPVLGKRVATHEFRVPVSDGVFNYRQLERGLSTLEDSVIDFETRANQLVLERDIPVVGMRKDLVRWHLPTEQDQFLAKAKSVRLRTLLRPEIVRDEQQSEKSELVIRRVSVGNLSVELSATRADGGAGATNGAITDVEMSGLSLTGEVHAFTDESGALALAIESLSLQIRDLDLGGVCVEHARVIVAGVRDTKLEFTGVAPCGLQLKVDEIRLEDVRLRVDQPSNR